MKALTITVIILTFHPDDKFRELVRRIHVQTVPPERILIINTGEKYFHPEDTADIPEAEVIHISEDEFDHGGTRDLAARMADTDLLVFMTQDAVPADRCMLDNMTRGFDDEDTAAVYARQLARRDSSALEKLTRRYNYGPETVKKTKKDMPQYGVKTFFCSNVCAAYRKDIYDKLGGFDKHTIFNEDMIFASKLIEHGYAVVYRADARVFHTHEYTGAQQFHRNFDLGVSQAMHPEVFASVSSENEGMTYVKTVIKELFRMRRACEIPGFIHLCICKYAGYLLGKNYRKLPGSMIRICTANESFWNKGADEDVR